MSQFETYIKLIRYYGIEILKNETDERINFTNTNRKERGGKQLRTLQRICKKKLKGILTSHEMVSQIFKNTSTKSPITKNTCRPKVSISSLGFSIIQYYLGDRACVFRNIQFNTSNNEQYEIGIDFSTGQNDNEISNAYGIAFQEFGDTTLYFSLEV